MSRVCVAIAVFAVVAVYGASIGEDYAAFQRYTKRFGKTYVDDKMEFDRHFVNYRKNMQSLDAARQQNPMATFGETEFSDMSEEEFMSYHNAGESIAQVVEQSQRNKRAEKFAGSLSSIPTSVDWRTKGAVTPVKNQRQCGSCWAFSTTGNIEGQWFLAGHNLTSLSEQFLVSCCPLSLGCNGGNTIFAEFWLTEFAKGQIPTEASYPYTSGGGVTGKCNDTGAVVGATITGATILLPWDVKGMETFVAERGPVSVAVYAGGPAWQSYTSGVMTACKSNLPDHMVLVVGYGSTSAGVDYWIVKNSWGQNWGESGYLRIERGKNLCNIELFPNSAVVPKK